MSALKRQQSSNLNESDEEDLSEREEENLEGILVLFPAREIKEEPEFIEDDTFEKVKNLLTCPICLDIFTEPVLVKKCLHRFCKTCIERVIRGYNLNSQINKSCPSCRVALGCKRILKNDTVTEEISNTHKNLNNPLVQKVFPDLQDYQKKEEEHQKLYYRSKTKEMQDNHNPLKRRRRELSPIRRTCSTPVLKETEVVEKKKEPEIKKVVEEKQKKPPKKLKEKQKKKKTFRRADTDIAILDIDPDNVIEIIEDNDDESDGIIILEDEPEEFIHKKKKTSSEQEVILIDESTDCEEVKDNKKLPKDLFPPKMPLMQKKNDPLAFLMGSSTEVQQYQALANLALQLEVINPLLMPSLIQEAALRPFDPLMVRPIDPLGFGMLPLMGLDRTGGIMPDQNFLKDIDKLIPKKHFDKELNLKELFNWTPPHALFGQPAIDPFALMNPSVLQMLQASKGAKDDKIIELK